MIIMMMRIIIIKCILTKIILIEINKNKKKFCEIP